MKADRVYLKIAGGSIAALVLCFDSAAVDAHQAAPIKVVQPSPPPKIVEAAPIKVVQPPPPPKIVEAAPIKVVQPPPPPKTVEAAPIKIVPPPPPPKIVEAAPRAPGSTSPAGQPGAGAARPAVVKGNAIEPISNGIAFTMSSNDLKQRYGEPGRRAGFPSCVMHYRNFTAETCGGKISRLYLSAPGIALRNGIGVGSRKADVARVFGNPAGSQLGPYKVAISYNGDRVSSVRVDVQSPAAGGQGKRPPSANYCAPNCGYDYSTGQAAPTIYNPNHNYSPYGR